MQEKPKRAGIKFKGCRRSAYTSKYILSQTFLPHGAAEAELFRCNAVCCFIRRYVRRYVTFAQPIYFPQSIENWQHEAAAAASFSSSVEREKPQACGFTGFETVTYVMYLSWTVCSYKNILQVYCICLFVQVACPQTAGENMQIVIVGTDDCCPTTDSWLRQGPALLYCRHVLKRRGHSTAQLARSHLRLVVVPAN